MPKRPSPTFRLRAGARLTVLLPLWTITAAILWCAITHPDGLARAAGDVLLATGALIAWRYARPRPHKTPTEEKS